jgi:hypothetical protein
MGDTSDLSDVMIRTAVSRRGEHAKRLRSHRVHRFDKEKGGPYCPRGVIRSLAAALGMYDAYNGLVPPNWGHPIAKQKDDKDMFGWTDEVIEWYSDHGDGYHGVDPALHRQRTNSPSLFESTTWIF